MLFTPQTAQHCWFGAGSPKTGHIGNNPCAMLNLSPLPISARWRPIDNVGNQQKQRYISTLLLLQHLTCLYIIKISILQKKTETTTSKNTITTLLLVYNSIYKSQRDLENKVVFCGHIAFTTGGFYRGTAVLPPKLWPNRCTGLLASQRFKRPVWRRKKPFLEKEDHGMKYDDICM